MSDVTFHAPGVDTASPTREVPVDDSPGPALGALDLLRDEVAREIEYKSITLEVPARPGWTVTYRCDVEMPEFNAWRKRAADRSQPDGIDELRFAQTVLANKCVGLAKDGVDLVTDGQAVTFRSSLLMEEFGVARPLDMVRRWYGVDGHILSAAEEVMRESGFGEGADRADPTQRS